MGSVLPNQLAGREQRSSISLSPSSLTHLELIRSADVTPFIGPIAMRVGSYATAE
jgi:hypothetical protein